MLGVKTQMTLKMLISLCFSDLASFPQRAPMSMWEQEFLNIPTLSELYFCYFQNEFLHLPAMAGREKMPTWPQCQCPMHVDMACLPFSVSRCSFQLIIFTMSVNVGVLSDILLNLGNCSCICNTPNRSRKLLFQQDLGLAFLILGWTDQNCSQHAF